jgi:hypothetical protein
MSGGTPYGQQYQGPAPSVGAGSFTSIMSRPSEGILAQAAAAEAPAKKKGFFKTYWPLILVFVVLIVVLVVVLIIFAKKH